MSFVYPRTISITRVPDSTLVSNHGYEGREYPLTVVYSDIPCSIQQKSQTTKPITGFPQDLSNDTLWRIYIPRRALAKGLILVRDVIVDDLDFRYEVLSNYWNSLGYNVLTKFLTS